MQILRYKDLTNALRRLQALRNRQVLIGENIAKLQQEIVAFYDRKNRTTYPDEDGVVWRKQQSTFIKYNDDEFKDLLRKKGIDPTVVYQERTIEERDETAITKLLREKKISVQEWQKVATIVYSSPYIRRG